MSEKPSRPPGRLRRLWPFRLRWTLAGLLLHESRTIPDPGQEFRFHHIRFRVIRRQGNRITSLRLWVGRPGRKARSGQIQSGQMQSGQTGKPPTARETS